MRIFNVSVDRLDESIIRSGYPKLLDVCEFKRALEPHYYEDVGVYITEQDESRANALGKVAVGSGHDCFLKGIIVQADIQAPSYWWPQFQRYHFADIVSSQATMHSILSMDLKAQMCGYVDARCVDIANEYIAKYRADQTLENFERILANVPRGIELTAAIVTNYLQLKTMYLQRKTHRLKMWRDVFCPWVESLPMVRELGVVK